MTYTISYILSTGLYSGKSPKAPGTVGTICFILLWISFHLLVPSSSLTLDIAIALTLILCGTISSQVVLTELKKNNANTKSEAHIDPKWIVIDEWAGQSIALLGISVLQPELIALSFILFRFFDISKLGPIRKAEELPGAIGIMADDIVAGLITLGIISFIQIFL